jgi:hypothetical protein
MSYLGWLQYFIESEFGHLGCVENCQDKCIWQIVRVPHSVVSSLGEANNYQFQLTCDEFACGLA